jgi:hypothetical protein
LDEWEVSVLVKRRKIQRANSGVKEPSQPANAYPLTRLAGSGQGKRETKDAEVFNTLVLFLMLLFTIKYAQKHASLV